MENAAAVDIKKVGELIGKGAGISIGSTIVYVFDGEKYIRVPVKDIVKDCIEMFKIRERKKTLTSRPTSRDAGSCG